MVAGYGNFLPRLDVIPSNELKRQVQVETMPDLDYTTVLSDRFVFSDFFSHFSPFVLFLSIVSV